MQTGSKKAIANASLRTTIQVLVATVLVALAQHVPGLRELNAEIVLGGAVALVVAGQQTLEHRFPALAAVLGNSNPIFLSVLEQFKAGELDEEDEPGTVSIPEEDLVDEADIA